MDGINASHHVCRAGEDGGLALQGTVSSCRRVDPSTGESGLHPARLAVSYGFLFCIEELATRGAYLEAATRAGRDAAIARHAGAVYVLHTAYTTHDTPVSSLSVSDIGLSYF